MPKNEVNKVTVDYQSVKVLGLDQDTRVVAWTLVEGGT